MNHRIIDVDSLTEFAKGLACTPIPTSGGRTTFTVHVVDGDMIFFPNSGNRRNHQRRYIEKVLDLYNASGDLRTPLYSSNGIVNASYQLGLMKLYLRQA